MRQLFALKSEPQEELTPEELAEKAREELAQRYEQARRWKESAAGHQNGAGQDAIDGRS